jgi:hypothetical protein
MNICGYVLKKLKPAFTRSDLPDLLDKACKNPLPGKTAIPFHICECILD